MEAVVVGCMFKSLITRCASTTHELHSPENLVSGGAKSSVHLPIARPVFGFHFQTPRLCLDSVGLSYLVVQDVVVKLLKAHFL